MSDDNQDYYGCDPDGEDDSSADTHREEQLCFAFITRSKSHDRSNPDVGDGNDEYDDLTEYASLEAREKDFKSHVAALDDELAAPPGPGLAIFSLLDVVEALKVSGAATAYQGWDGVIAYAKAHMASMSSTRPQAAPVAESFESAYDAGTETGGRDAPTSVLGLGPSRLVYPSLPAYPDQSIFDALRTKTRARKINRPTITLDADEAPGNEAPRLKRLLGLYEDQRGARRAMLIADEGMINRLHDLDCIAPSFKKVTGLVRRSALLSRLTCTSMVVPPILPQQFAAGRRQELLLRSGGEGDREAP